MSSEAALEVLGWRDGHIVALDQTALPHEVRMLHLTTVAELVVIVFVLEIIVPTNAYLKVQASTELITLHISDWYRVVALMVGTGLISIIALLRLLESTLGARPIED